MSFLEKKKMKHGPEPAEELFVRVHVGEGDPQYDSVFVLPASNLTRPRLAPLVAMAEGTHQGGDGCVIRIKCGLSDFAQAMALTAVEEAAEGRTAWGRVVAPAGSRRFQAREASILEQALTGDSADRRGHQLTRGRKKSKAKSTKSLAARIGERLRDYMATKHKPSPQTTPPPPCDTSFRPTWARNRRMTSVPRSQL